jgi:serine phosphatase RsbU (regulator of sigma subunit)
MGLLFLFLVLLLTPPEAVAQELYWENPRTFVSESARFPKAASGGSVAAVIWQEFEQQTEEGGTVSLAMKTRTGSEAWKERGTFAGPFPYTGKESPIFSLSIDNTGRILVAVSTKEKQVSIFSSEDNGESFQRISTIEADTTLIAPRLFAKDDGGYILYTTKEWTTEEGGDALSIFYTITEDGRNWSELKPLVSDPGKSLNFLPHHTSAYGREYVAFQVLETGEQTGYQIYLKISEDGGQSWSEAKWLTGFEEYRSDGDNDPYNYNNQRPYIAPVGDQLAVAWERSYRRENPQIYYARVTREGSISGEPERITMGTRYCNYPQIITVEDHVYLLWFDDRAGDEHVILADKTGVFWEERDLSRMDGVSMFPWPIIEDDELYLVWENRRGKNSRLVYLAPDKTVDPPNPVPLNFAAGERFSQDLFSLRWQLPRDSSGIAGISYLWDREPDSTPPKELKALQSERERTFRAREDGKWYFHARTQDYAGNWSEPVTVSVFRDTTPPGTVDFMPLERDDEGYLRSNTFSIRWKPPPGEDPIGGYSYRLQYLSSLESRATPRTISLSQPPSRILTSSTQVSFNNRDNGYWAFTVRAIDSVGNVGEPETIFFKMNKYIPVTYITSVNAPKDDLGRIEMQIRGRGFAVGGLINQVILDRDGERPYDYTFERDLGLYSVVSDRLIVGPEIEDIEEGVYRVGLIHPKRGLYFTRPFLELEPSGTIKFGDFRERIGYGWKKLKQIPFSLTVNDAVLYLVLGFLALVLVFSVFKVAGLVKETRTLRYEIEALIAQKELPARIKKERIEVMKKRGMGLRVKFTLFITTIIIVVVLGVSLYLGNFMIQTQRENLATGLKQQTEVLLESLAAGARENLPRKDVLALDSVISQRTAMDDALYATITGEGENDKENFDYVWATDDPNISNKIEADQLTLGSSRIQDSVSPAAEQMRKEINQTAREQVSELNNELDRLGERAVELATQEGEEAARQLQEYQQEITALEKKLNQELQEIGDVIGSEPDFNVEKLSSAYKSYVFYKPVVYASRGEDVYYRGMVRVGVSTERILSEIEESRQNLTLTTIIIAAIAIGLGIAGALLFASIMIIPITRLVHGVETIRDTEDKEQLRDHQIAVRSRDEIATLADTVNQMTQGLVKAAAANKDLIVGKEVQKMFIPLEKDNQGNKLTTGQESNDRVSFFGYYEGAKGVSGDYFDFRKLDDKHYGIIKCDVAGKGVPASLIMVEVATIFLDYFRNWSINREGTDLSKLAYNMNDLIEERGFKGRFAALILVILNIETGECYFCNAGDNLVHIYDNSAGKMVQKVLPESPAAGVFPSMLVEMQSGFQVVKHQLDPGDTMFLFTDGVEEAQRKFRDENFNLTTCQEPGIEDGEAHGNHNKGSEFEELGIPRIYDIVNAVFGNGQYKLYKYHNPVGDEDLVFDFSNCEGTIDEAIIALVAVEKIFRIYPDPSATADDRVYVDTKIDAFLREHFMQYDDYFTNPVEGTETSGYVQFTHLKEDEQFDDLTILGIKKQ